MSQTYSVKKSPQGDWHRADIVAALKKAGWSLSCLALHHNYSHRSTLNNALNGRGWPKGEEIIAEAIRSGGEYPNIQPWDIWPSRYLTVYKSTPRKSTRRQVPLHVKNERKN